MGILSFLFSFSVGGPRGRGINRLDLLSFSFSCEQNLPCCLPTQDLTAKEA